MSIATSEYSSASSLVGAVYLLVEEVESRVNLGSRSPRQIEDNAHVLSLIQTYDKENGIYGNSQNPCIFPTIEIVLSV